MSANSGEKQGAGGRADEGASAELDRRNARTGLLLFFVYLVFYAGFMAWTVLDPHSMARPAWFGVNRATLYGFGLIVTALALALLYMRLCRRPHAGARP